MEYLMRVLGWVGLAVFIAIPETYEFTSNVAFTIVIFSPILVLVSAGDINVYKTSDRKETALFKLFKFLDVIYLLTIAGLGFLGVFFYSLVMYIAAYIVAVARSIQKLNKGTF